MYGLYLERAEMKESIRKKIVTDMSKRLDELLEHGVFELAKLSQDGPLYLRGSSPYTVRALEEIKELVVLEFFDDVYRLDRILAAMLVFTSSNKYHIQELHGLRNVGVIITPKGTIHLNKVKFI